MESITAIRKQADKLEAKISELLKGFVKDNGDCDIDLSCQLTYEHTHAGNKKDLVGVGVKVNVTI